MPKQANYAVVVDLQAELIHHPNGADYLRLLLTQREAQTLYFDLKELLDG